MCEWHRQWSRPSVVAEKTHGLLLKGAMCLSERRLDKFVLVCEHLLKLPFEQSLPMRPGRICSCLHTAWAVIPEVPLNFLLSESSAALKLRIHRGWREKRHEIMSRDSPSIVQISSVTYIYTHFFFLHHSSTLWCWQTFTFFSLLRSTRQKLLAVKLRVSVFLPKMLQVENSTFSYRSTF